MLPTPLESSVLMPVFGGIPPAAVHPLHPRKLHVLRKKTVDGGAFSIGLFLHLLHPLHPGRGSWVQRVERVEF